MGEIAVIEYVLTYLWTALDYTGAAFLLDGFSARRFKRGCFCGIAACFIVLESTALNWIIFETAFYAKMLFVLLVYVAFYFVEYRSGAVFSFFMAVIYYAISSCVDNLCSTFVLVLGIVPNATSPALSFGLPLFVRCITISFCCIQRNLRIKNGAVPSNWRFYTVPMIFSFVNIVLVFFYGVSFQEGEITEIPLFVCALFLTSVQLAALYLVSWMEKNAHFREEAISLQTKSHAQQENMEALSAAYAHQRKLTHDFRAHLELLGAFLEREDGAPQARSYLCQLKKIQISNVLFVATKNTALDALLSQKALIAKKRKIDIQFVVNDLSLVQIAMVDLTVVISNILENAIEACEKLPEEERQIHVQVLLEEEDLFFSVKNRALPVVLLPQQLPLSTKENPDFHGYGLENVCTILKKYNALYTMEYSNGWFQFATELPNALLS